ncbi:hypothetical protein [Streptomyces zaomyceticus]|uniref:Uncharacterized protein n=1 Tax=Streptomyces zaomyceticus TaxID=68286 RepID=A0ABZ1LQZ9_9ACTN|nr:hypothetical protein OG237_42365 [Streptomyces zaomyceticus]
MRLRRTGRISDRDWLLRPATLIDRQTPDADPADGKTQTALQTIVDKLLACDTANNTNAGASRRRRPHLDGQPLRRQPPGVRNLGRRGSTAVTAGIIATIRCDYTDGTNDSNCNQE